MHSKFKIKNIQFPQSFSSVVPSPKCSKLIKQKRLRKEVEVNERDQ